MWKSDPFVLGENGDQEVQSTGRTCSLSKPARYRSHLRANALTRSKEISKNLSKRVVEAQKAERGYELILEEYRLHQFGHYQADKVQTE